MTPQVTVVDYGIGNIHSVVKALRYLGAEVALTESPEDVASAARLLVPGVGAFADGLRGLKERGLDEAILQHVATGRPLMAICLGMQLLLTESIEFGTHRGLDVVPGRVVEIPRAPGVKVPQIGWNRIAPPPGGSWTGTPLAEVEPGTMVYFVHSFSAVPSAETDRLADTVYGGFRVSAAVRRGNVVGVQFHPEKSGPVGLSILQQFLSN